VKERLADVTQRIKSTDRDETQRREDARAKAQREITPGRAKLQRAENLVFQQGVDYARMTALLAEAIEHLTNALLLLPADPEVLHLRGQAQALLRNSTEAEKDYTAALKANKSYSAAF
jgi:Flp pilus assembly protein TadD